MLFEPGVDALVGHVVDGNPVRFPVRKGGRCAFFGGHSLHPFFISTVILKHITTTIALISEPLSQTKGLLLEHGVGNMGT
jgi:hypothetical protein